MLWLGEDRFDVRFKARYHAVKLRCVAGHKVERSRRHAVRVPSGGAWVHLMINAERAASDRVLRISYQLTALDSVKDQRTNERTMDPKRATHIAAGHRSAGKCDQPRIA